MSRRNEISAYEDLDGQVISLAGLEREEQALVAKLRLRAQTNPDWNDFDNYSMRAVGDFYVARGMPRKEIIKTAAWQIAQDLGGRLGIAAGLVRSPDYREDLQDLIRFRYKTRRAFCKATGISETMLSHVLAGRKHLAIDTLEKALQRIRYRIRIAPVPVKKGKKRSSA